MMGFPNYGTMNGGNRMVSFWNFGVLSTGSSARPGHVIFTSFINRRRLIFFFKFFQNELVCWGKLIIVKALALLACIWMSLRKIFAAFWINNPSKWRPCCWYLRYLTPLASLNFSLILLIYSWLICHEWNAKRFSKL